MTDNPTPESARALLYRHGLPEDVIDGVLCLHAQELAAVQRREATVWGVDTAAGKHILAAADLIDPTRTASAGLGVSATPSHTDLRDRIRRAICEHDGKDYLWGTELLEPDEYGEIADAVLAELPPPADRAAILREAADAVAALREETFTNVAVYPVYDGSQRLALSNAESRLRRLADEAQQQERSDVGTPEDRCAECGHFQGAHEEAEEPVSVGRCTVCADDDAWHNYEATEEERRLAGARRQPAAAPEPEPPVHGESVAHLAGDHDDEPAVDARQDGAQQS